MGTKLRFKYSVSVVLIREEEQRLGDLPGIDQATLRRREIMLRAVFGHRRSIDSGSEVGV